ncbi:hypothetical protein VTL71DRAFT_2196 [Oculimacula yallundae]|uniref:Uncharacterized protein n=1 Tax=Oculimacula yallundae TaxID=86028 RepID=A0ABR4C891_9HELO
MAEIANLFRYY